MDPRDPYQPPSIFKTPDVPDDEADTSTRVPTPPRAPTFTPRLPPPSEPEPSSGPSRRLLVAMGAGGLTLLLIGGFVAASVLRPAGGSALASASPTLAPPPSPAATPMATAVPSASAGPTVTPSPVQTPVPTPAGPPQDLAVGGWATVAVAELNVRSAADMNAAPNYVLVRGAVVNVAEGPVVASGLNWYRVASLGGARGWATSGWVEEPFMTTVVADPTLIRCGELNRSVFDIVDGAPVPHDPVAIGDLALPAAAFTDIALGAMELLRGVGAEACFSAQVGADGTPIVTPQLSANACGRAVREGSFFRLRPATGQTVPPEYQVKDPVVLHPAVLTSMVPNDPLGANLQHAADLIAARSDATGCFHVTVQGESGNLFTSTAIDTEQCFITYEYATEWITIGAAAGGDARRLLVTMGPTAPFPFALNVPVYLYVSVGSSDGGNQGPYGPSGGSYGYVYQGYDEDCA